MIRGIRKEAVIRWYTVSGEAATDRPYSVTKIVADELCVTWERTVDNGWRVARVKLIGWRAKADGTAGGNHAEDAWSWYPERGCWSSDVDPPLWATLIATRDIPSGGPLAALVADVEPVELDL